MLPSIIGVSGQIEAGKDTFFRVFQGQVEAQRHPQFAFADGVKKVVETLTGDSDQWSREGKARVVPGFKQSNGLLQQIVGAGMRNTIDPDVWVRACMRRVQEALRPRQAEWVGDKWMPVKDETCTDHHQYIGGKWKVIKSGVYVESRAIITDVRYPGEVLAIQAAGGVVVRIERPGHVPKDDGRDLKHESETALDDFKGFDYVLRNAGTLEDYEKSIRDLLKTMMALAK